MCGIIGYIGNQNCAPLLLNGLQRMEYRGYDSAGLAVRYRNTLQTHRVVGKVNQLERKVPEKLSGKAGIAHTRWATQGAVTEPNAHPQISMNGEIAVVHNGIIENYEQLHEELSADGFSFSSETDTEVIPMLIEKYYTDDFEKAFNSALGRLEGAYGIVAMLLTESDYLMAARKGSPLLLGVGDNEMFIASDQAAFLEQCKRVVDMEDYEVAKIDNRHFSIRDARNNRIHREVRYIEDSVELGQKEGYPHFMLKEIFEQPVSIGRTLAGRLVEETASGKLNGLALDSQQLFRTRKIEFIAAGTSYYSSLVGAYMIEKLARIETTVHIASESRCKNPLINKDGLYFFVSQSGETADTLFSLKEYKRKGARTLGICNVVGSSIARESDSGVYTYCGHEVAVASTKSFVSQLAVMSVVAIILGRMRDVGFNRGRQLIEQLADISQKINTILKLQDQVAAIAKRYRNSGYFLFLGRGINYPVALEGALKLKEVSYIHAEGVAGGEIKHGPIAVIQKGTPVIVIAPKDENYEKMLHNVKEVKARGAEIIAIGYAADRRLPNLADHFLDIPQTDPLLSPILSVIPLQLLAYYLGVELECEIDQPRNLAKSVTVE